MHLRAYAKINPYLNITGKRQDGYHDLSIVFRPVSLYDEVTVEERAEKGVVLTCSDETLAGPENIIFKAYAALLKVRPEAPGYRVHIDKNIPSGAGMGGGSSDAAAFLRGADTVSGLGLTEEELSRIGAGVGADVPACLLKHPSIGGGIGDVLDKAPAPALIYYIIVKPPVSFSTPAMYKKYDELLAAGRLPSGIPSVSSVQRAMEKGDVRAEMKHSFNIFEKAVPDRKLICAIKKELIKQGACGALMTGSGSAVFGAFEKKADRDKACRRILKLTREDGPFKDCFAAVCESVNEKQETHYVYMLECPDGTYYTGWTNNIEKRLAAHNSGKGAKYTKAHAGGKARLVHLELFDNKSDSLKREYEIKQLSKNEKVKLIYE